MDTSLLVESWKRAFGNALPAAFLLRQHLSDRWVRVHSLPESKRYADSASEYEEILSRQNSVGSFVLGEGNRCTLFIARFGEDRQWSDDALIALIGGVPTHLLASDDPEEPMQFFGLQATWRKHAFDKLICAVADDKTGPVLFANADAHAIYAPYDGGADLFFPSSSEANMAKSRFGSWLSTREDGL